MSCEDTIFLPWVDEKGGFLNESNLKTTSHGENAVWSSLSFKNLII